jgi:hypothetical protein
LNYDQQTGNKGRLINETFSSNIQTQIKIYKDNISMGPAVNNANIPYYILNKIP